MAMIDSAGREILEDIWRLHKHVLEIHDTILSCNNMKELKEGVEEAVEEAEMMKDIIARKSMVFIIRYQPLGRDLLLAETSINVAYDLYRIARYFREIVAAVEQLGGFSNVLSQDELQAFVQLKEMIELAISTYMSWKPHAVKKVIDLDNVYDELYRRYLNLVLKSEQVDSKIALRLLIVRHMERIADHATYIVRSAERLWKSPSLSY
ncbi:MAG: phosphate uptake regulator PhoU [Acidilobaceae archaeon]